MTKENLIKKYNELKNDSSGIGLLFAMRCLEYSDGCFQDEMILENNDDLKYELAVILNNVFSKYDEICSYYTLADNLMKAIKDEGLEWVKNACVYELINYFYENYVED